MSMGAGGEGHFSTLFHVFLVHLFLEQPGTVVGGGGRGGREEHGERGRRGGEGIVRVRVRRREMIGQQLLSQPLLRALT